MSARLGRLRYLLGVMGGRGLALRILAQALSPIYYSEELAVTNGYITSIEDDRESGPGAVNSESVFTVEDLVARRPRIHPDLDFDYMVRFLEEGTDQARVSLKSLEDEHGEITYIGQSAYDAGEFRMPEYGFGGPVSDHVEVSYEWELAPEYRGR